MNLLKILPLLFIAFSCKNPKETAKIEKDNAPVLTERKVSKIDSICQSFIAKGNTVGFSIGLAYNGNVIFSKGYGIRNVESKAPATDSTIYPIASVSKFITAITTLRMVEQGKLSLQNKVVDFLKDFPKQQYMEVITIEHLLRHQSGLVDHENFMDSIFINEKRKPTQKEFFAFLDKPLFFRPGTGYSYSNSGYAILSAILEQVENNSFHNSIINQISKPLNASSIGVWPEMWGNKNATMGYELAEKGVDTSFHMMTAGMKGDGGLSASVLDLLKIAMGLENETLITKKSLENMLMPTPVGSIEIDYGLGVKMGSYSGQKTYGHSGGYMGTGWALLAHYPETGVTFAAAMNTNYSPEEMWALRHLIMPVVLEVEPPTMETKTIKDIQKYIGVYQKANRWGEAMASSRVVSVQGDSLVWDNPETDHPGSQLVWLNTNTFTWKPYPFDEFKFHEVDGKIVACSQYYDGLFGNVWMKIPNQ